MLRNTEYILLLSIIQVLHLWLQSYRWMYLNTNKTLFLLGFVYDLNALEGAVFIKTQWISKGSGMPGWQSWSHACGAYIAAFLALFVAEMQIPGSICAVLTHWGRVGYPSSCFCSSEVACKYILCLIVEACCSTPWSCFIWPPLRSPPNGMGTEPAEWMPIV